MGNINETIKEMLIIKLRNLEWNLDHESGQIADYNKKIKELIKARYSINIMIDESKKSILEIKEYLKEQGIEYDTDSDTDTLS